MVAFINLAIGSARQFYRMQLQYRVAVQKVFNKHIEDIDDKLKEIPLTMDVDIRYDTPGFCANKSTAVFMEIGDYREVGRHSPNMERLLIERGLNYIHVLNVSPYLVWEIISDASRNLISFMRTDPFKHLQHSLDIWHKAKKLAFLLADIAKNAANKDLLPWIRPVINHFWYCCSASKGNIENYRKSGSAFSITSPTKTFCSGEDVIILKISWSSYQNYLIQIGNGLTEILLLFRN